MPLGAGSSRGASALGRAFGATVKEGTDAENANYSLRLECPAGQVTYEVSLTC